MTRADIFLKLRHLLQSLYPQTTDRIESVNEQSSLVNDLGMDSIGLLCMVIAIEESFEVDFEGTSLKDFTTVESVIDYIQEKLVDR